MGDCFLNRRNGARETAGLTSDLFASQIAIARCFFAPTTTGSHRRAAQGMPVLKFLDWLPAPFCAPERLSNLPRDSGV